jgi:lysozyme
MNVISANDPELLAMEIRHEGFEPLPYLDSKRIWTIGMGYNMEAHGIPAHLVKLILDQTGITRLHAEELLKGGLREAISDLQSIFPAFANMSRNRQLAFVDMRFNMGPGNPLTGHGFRGMRRMVRAAQQGNWIKAAAEAQDSDWYRDVRTRGPKIVGMIREG